jgi:PhnB protein
MHIEPYLFFEGRCEEAVEFYRKAIGADVVALIRFRESPDKTMIPPGMEDKVMHACLRVGNAAVMASDGMGTGAASFKGFALTLNVADEPEARQKFDALSDGGRVTMPLSETFFAQRFGMVNDRFGVAWMIMFGPKG